MDTLITGGQAVTEAGVIAADLGIRGGRIAAIAAPGALSSSASEVVDAAGLLVLPGAVDLHTHFTGSHDRPLDEVREGTLGAAIGGITTVVEMPHSAPPATTLEAFRRKQALFASASAVDFALWAGLDGRNLEELPALNAAGAVAFKAFLTSGDPSGAATDEKGLPRLGDADLVRAMDVIRGFDGLIGVHAENHELLTAARLEQQAQGRRDARAHAAAGPELAEIEAVSRLLVFAGRTGVRLHVVHVSSAAAAGLIRAARDGVRVTFETCPHYLILDEDDLARIGADARCGPPLRPRTTVEALWTHVLDGAVDAIASDHCPYRPEQKRVGDASIWEAGMGLTGIETSAPMAFSEGVKRRGLSVVEFARMTATGPAKIAGLYPRKGAIRVGADADLALYDPTAEWQVRGSEFHGLGTWSAFEGMTCTGRVVRTLVRGRTVQHDRRRMAEPGFGRFLTRFDDIEARS
ncbi:allantoinase AllB [Segnochrobactrum spirostomi]|uniref:allantoinase n=1 Tax=Segnochrobactrum spirostomi TaxID=2608987 RepID=A0A6A7YCK6_9HYPH|nr:allantoinase AllB [Segnochrobactrum spirostomi]MQT15432.1 allantoinase AllB [Segnochrobactrum spirostomi]